MMSKTSLPPGFRFHPTDVELVWYYLKRKVMGKPFQFEAISEVELYKFAPWELPEKSQLCTKDLEWYFFCPRDRKYSNGSRTNRATNIGYWKATGRDRSVIHNSHKVGTKKTLIFHVGKPPKGNRTDWVMYEYQLENKEFIDAGSSQDAYVLCKIFQKSGPGPKTGEQYGAPFNEEDWEDDTTTKSSFPLPSVSCPSPEPIDDQAITLDPVSRQPMASTVPDVSSDPDLLDADGIFLEELATFLNSSLLRENANGEMPDSTIIDTNDNEASVMDPEGTHNELEDNSVQTVISANINHPENILSEIALQPMLSELDNEQYMELNDFYFIWDGGPSENIMPNDTFAQNPSAHSPNFWTPSHIHDPTFYFDNDVSGMCDLQAEPDMSKQYSPRMQIGDFWGFTPHLNVPVSDYQHYHLLEEFPPASFSDHFG